jgi:hypothetical protein
LQIQDMMSTAAPASGALLANSLGSVSESAPTGAEAKEPAAEEAVVDPKDVCSKNADFITSKALEWGLQVLCAGNKVEFAVVDIMSWICKSKEEECKKVITSLLEAIRGASEKETDHRIKVKEADERASLLPRPQRGNDGKVRAHGALPVEIIECLSLHLKPDVWARSLMGLLRVLAILVNESVDCCRVAYEQDAFGVITKLLYVKGNAAVSDESAKSAADKTQGEEEEQSQAEPASGSQEQSSNSMAKLVGILKAHEKEAEANQWLCSSLLILNKILIHNEHAKVAESVLDREMYEKEQARLAVRKEAEERAKREEEMMSSDNEQQVLKSPFLPLPSPLSPCLSLIHTHIHSSTHTLAHRRSDSLARSLTHNMHPSLALGHARSLSISLSISLFLAPFLQVCRFPGVRAMSSQLASCSFVSIVGG